MSEVDEKPQTSELVSDKSDDKLQIEKEEKQKAEDIVGEMFSEKENKEKEEAQTEVSEMKEEIKNEEVKKEESPTKETEEATGSEEKTEETEEKVTELSDLIHSQAQTIQELTVKLASNEEKSEPIFKVIEKFYS